MATETIRNLSRSDALRRDIIVINDPDPVLDRVYTLVPDCIQPFRIVNVKASLGGPGGAMMDLLFAIDGVEVLFDVSESDPQSIPIVTGALQEAITNETSLNEDECDEGETLTMKVEDISSADVTDLIVQVQIEYLKENVVVSD